MSLTSVGSLRLVISRVAGSWAILPRTLAGGKRRHVHPLHGGGALSTSRSRPVVHLLPVPITIVTYKQEEAPPQ